MLHSFLMINRFPSILSLSFSLSSSVSHCTHMQRYEYVFRFLFEWETFRHLESLGISFNNNLDVWSVCLCVCVCVRVCALPLFNIATGMPRPQRTSKVLPRATTDSSSEIIWRKRRSPTSWIFTRKNYNQDGRLRHSNVLSPWPWGPHTHTHTHTTHAHTHEKAPCSNNTNQTRGHRVQSFFGEYYILTYSIVYNIS